MSRYPNQERLGKLAARMSCPPHGMKDGSCSFELYEDIDETCAACWVEYLEPIYQKMVEADSQLSLADAVSAALLNQGELAN